MNIGAVLVTGSSSGIGRATVEALVDRGHTVWASARRTEQLADLIERGARAVALDVTDEASMTAAVRAVEAEHGAVGALVNNAGYGEYGPVERVSPDRVRRQYETNVIGPLRLAQLVLPSMRAAGRGHIVNVTSMGGRFVFPGGGVYHSSKYALEALSDAMRFEVEPFGVKVTVVEPGLTRSGFGQSSAATLPLSDGPYADFEKAVAAQMADAFKGRLAVEAASVGAAIADVLEGRRKAPRQVLSPAAKGLVHLRRLGGTRVWDTAMRRQLAPYLPSG